VYVSSDSLKTACSRSGKKTGGDGARIVVRVPGEGAENRRVYLLAQNSAMGYCRVTNAPINLGFTGANLGRAAR
jgi:hypothetical protein